MKMIAQGDVLFIERNEEQNGEVIPSGIVATGEITGHTHRIRPGQEAILRMLAGVMYIEALRETVVEHVILPTGTPTGDHSEVVLPPGNWEVRRQREWAPEGYRQVAD